MLDPVRLADWRLVKVVGASFATFGVLVDGARVGDIPPPGALRAIARRGTQKQRRYVGRAVRKARRAGEW
jgi:hypothetical protein